MKHKKLALASSLPLSTSPPSTSQQLAAMSNIHQTLQNHNKVSVPKAAPTHNKGTLFKASKVNVRCGVKVTTYAGLSV